MTAADPPGPDRDEQHPDRDRGWRRGPDPDQPPWSRSHRSTSGPQEGGAAGEQSKDEPGEPTTTTEKDQADDGHQLAVRRPGQTTRPPRRTGVFVDTDDLREHVGALLRVLLGGYEVDAFGNFTFVHDDARVFITVGASPVGPQVGVFSVTNLDVDLTPALATFLLTTNHTLGFGAFSYDPPNRAVWLRYTLLGTTLDGPELHAAVVAVSTTAAQFDDAIRERFGGRTFHEAPDEVQRRVEPPETRDSARPPGASGYL